MKVVITNAVLTNTGDAAILFGIIESLNEVGKTALSEVTVIDANAHVTTRVFPQLTVKQQLTYSPRRGSKTSRRAAQVSRRGAVLLLRKSAFLRRALYGMPFSCAFVETFRAYADADLVISSGGTYLVDHYNFSPRAEELELCNLLGKPVVLWTQSVGPFKTSPAQKAARRIAPIASMALFRDDRSRTAWNALGVGGTSRVTPDAAFALPKIAGQQVRSTELLVSVRAWNRTSDGSELTGSSYRDAVRAAADRALAEGLRVAALSTCQGVPGYIDDSEVASRFFAGRDVLIDRQHRTPTELATVVAGVQAVLSTRMHMAILALINKTPVAAIAYEFKTIELFESLGMPHAVVPIEECTPARMSDLVSDLISSPSRYTLDDQSLLNLQRGCNDACAKVLQVVDLFEPGKNSA